MIFSFLHVRPPSSDPLPPTIYWLPFIEPHICVYNVYHRGTGRKEDTIFFRMPDAMQEISIVVVSVSVSVIAIAMVAFGMELLNARIFSPHLLIFVSPYSPPPTFIISTFIQIQPTKPPLFFLFRITEYRLPSTTRYDKSGSFLFLRFALSPSPSPVPLFCLFSL